MNGSSYVQTAMMNTWTHREFWILFPSLPPHHPQTFIDIVFLVQLPWCSLLSFIGLSGHVPWSSLSIRESVSQGQWLCDQRLWSGGSYRPHLKVCGGPRLQSPRFESSELPGSKGPPRLRDVNMISHTHLDEGVARPPCCFSVGNQSCYHLCCENLVLSLELKEFAFSNYKRMSI